MTQEQIEEVARQAAKLYGQDWAKIPQWSREIWRSTVQRSDPPGTAVERCAAEAKRSWERKRVEPEEVKPVEKKSKNKK